MCVKGIHKAQSFLRPCKMSTATIWPAQKLPTWIRVRIRLMLFTTCRPSIPKRWASAAYLLVLIKFNWKWNPFRISQTRPNLQVHALGPQIYHLWFRLPLCGWNLHFKIYIMCVHTRVCACVNVVVALVICPTKGKKRKQKGYPLECLDL